MDALALFIGIGAAIVGSLVILIALIIYLMFLRNRRKALLATQKAEQNAAGDQQVYEEIEEDRTRAPPVGDTDQSHIYYDNDAFEQEPYQETDADGRPIGNGIVRNGVVSFTTPEYNQKNRFKKKTQKGNKEHKAYGSPKGNNNNGVVDERVPVGLRNIHDTMY